MGIREGEIRRDPGRHVHDGRSYRFPAEVDQNDPTLTVALGIPTLGVFGLLQGGGHLGFSPIIPMTGEAIFKAQKVFGQALCGARSSPVGNQFSALPWSYNPRALVLLFGLPDVAGPGAEPAEPVDLRASSSKPAPRTAGPSTARTSRFMDKVAESYSFNDHAMRRFHETLKDAVDPNGILSPGKSGIWPRRLRDA